MLISKPDKHLTWVEIDLNAIGYNLLEIRKIASLNKFIIPSRENNLDFKPKVPVDVLAVVKANAYGHGVDKIVKLLNKQKVNFFAVSDIREGIHLRKIRIKKPILLFESNSEEFIEDICNYNLTPTVCNLDFAYKLNACAISLDKIIKVQVKIDTGMSRLGIPQSDAYDFIVSLFNLKNLVVEGIYTHFPSADIDKTFTNKQIKDLYELVIKLDKSGMIIPYIHASNSMGLAGYKTHVLNLARPGLMFYGLNPNKKLIKNLDLRPAMSVKSTVFHLKTIQKGQGVSYGRTFIAKRKMKIAIIPIGYNDGYFRAFSNKAFMLVDGIKCPVLGNVTMDQTIIDVSRVMDVKLGDEVVVMGKQKKASITADMLAKFADTINYEIVCSLGNRLPRVYV